MFRDLIYDPDDDFPIPETFLDVPYVPSDDEVVEAMLKLAGVGPKDLLYDLGSGDGRIVIAAAKRHGARAIGIEMDPLRIADAMEYAGDEGVECQVDFLEEDLFDTDLSPATVVTMYLLESINAQLRPRLLETLRPGSRIISHAFDMGDWQPDQCMRLNGATIYKWVVPAHVAGTWQWAGADGTPYQATLQQHYQEITGEAQADGAPAELQNARLEGATLSLELHLESGQVKHFTLSFADGALFSAIEH